MSSQDQSQDQQSDAEEPEADVEVGDQPAAEEEDDGAPATTSKDGEPDDERIAGITERIDKARSQAEDAGVLVDTDEEHFADSGVTESDDDQTIAPPG